MVKDLSIHHAPIGTLFSTIQSSDDYREHLLSGDQIAFFRENGFLAGVPMLTTPQVEALVAELDEISRPTHEGHHLFYEYHSNESRDPNRKLFHALGAWRIAQAFHDLAWNAAFVAPASQLLGGPVRFWHDQLFCKPARDGGVVAWHQDYSYWTRTRPMAHLSCFIALDDSTRENGCLQYVPGSHRWNLLPITGLAGDMHAIETVLTPEQKEHFNPIPVELKRGEASFHHPMMVHGSRENNTERPRRATVINVFLDGVCSASDSPPLEGVPAIKSGEKMQGQFFPLLFDPETLERRASGS